MSLLRSFGPSQFGFYKHVAPLALKNLRGTSSHTQKHCWTSQKPRISLGLNEPATQQICRAIHLLGGITHHEIFDIRFADWAAHRFDWLQPSALR